MATYSCWSWGLLAILLVPVVTACAAEGEGSSALPDRTSETSAPANDDGSAREAGTDASGRNAEAASNPARADEGTNNGSKTEETALATDAADDDRSATTDDAASHPDASGSDAPGLDASGPNAFGPDAPGGNAGTDADTEEVVAQPDEGVGSTGVDADTDNAYTENTGSLFDAAGDDDAGAAGDSDAPDSGVKGCPLSAPFSCDDGNGCTVDTLDETCVCVHEAMPEGAACNDGDVCTSGDRCTLGACSGQYVPSTPQVLGTLRSFGDAPDIKTIVGFVGDDRAVFAAGKTLALVGIDSDGLTLLDRRDVDIGVRGEVLGSMIPVLRPRTFLFSVGHQRVALVGDQTGIDLYDIGEDQLVPSGSYAFALSDGYAVAAAGAEGRAWVCTTGVVIHGYAIDSETSAIKEGPSLAGLPAPCQGLALSPDGSMLLVTMGANSVTGGLALVDVSSADGTMSIKTVTLADKYLLDVAMAGDYIATYQLRSEFGGGDVLVLDAHTLAQVAAFTASDPGGTPVGFAMTDDGLVLQRQLSDGTCSSYVAELYGLAPEGPTLRADWRLVDACQSFGGNTPLHTVGLGHYAALEPTHQIVRIDPASGAMVPLRGPQQGSFERVLPAGENTVEVHGPTNAQLIDISQPDAPVVTVGGLYAPVHAELLQLELSERADPVLLAVPGTKTVGPVTSLLWGKKGELPAVTGSIANDDADHEWVASGNYLYQWAPQSTQDFRVRRFPLSSLMHANRQTLLPDIDQVLTTDPPAELSVRHQSFLRVDPRTGDLLITEPRSLPSDFGNSSYVLTWFSLSSGGYVRAFATPPATTSVVDVALFNGRILVVALDRASILARTGETTIRRDVDPTSIVLSAVLGFNERLVYLRSRFPGSPATTGVVVLRADDLSEVARYTTRETVFSAAEVNNKLAFGMRTAITVASPACP